MTLDNAFRVTVVGSAGRMGSMFLRRFREAGLNTAGADLPLDPPMLAQACAGSRIVLLCVPAAAVEATTCRLVPHMSGATVLADIVSVKERPLRCMERHWPGPVVGTHPLFGPVFDPDADLPVAVTPGKRADETAVVLVEALFRAVGCRVFRTTAEEHDRAMAWIQGMNFVDNAAYFAMMSENPYLLPFLTPSFRRRLASARKQLTEDAELFTGLFEANPYSHEAVRHYRRLLRAAAGGDIDLLVQKAQWWWRNGDPSAVTPTSSSVEGK